MRARNGHSRELCIPGQEPDGPDELGWFNPVDVESIEETPTAPATFRQAGIFTLDGTGSMTLESEQLGMTKADAANVAVRGVISRFRVSSKRDNFWFSFVDFHQRIAHETPLTRIEDLDENGNYDPTRHGTDGTNIGAGLLRSGQIAAEFLADPESRRLPSSAVIVVLSDGECFFPDKTIEIADAMKADERITIACCYFATKGQPPSPDGTRLLQAICTNPAQHFTVAYDAETIRRFFIASVTAGAGLGDEGM